MKVLTVVGARPQFIKAAVVSRELRKRNTEILVHTGQHYDYNMSDVFFDELEIPKPDYNLGISGGTHGEMTGRMLEAIEDILIKEKADVVLIYGDTNSTLAAALAAVKLHIPICHIEAGVRTHVLSNPEEVNRVCSDHVSSLLLACTETAIENLNKEGLGDICSNVGDPMYEAFLYYSEKITSMKPNDLIDKDGNKVEIPEKFYYMTCHREENTQKDEQLKGILDAMNSLDFKTIYPVHPRNRERIKKLCNEKTYHNLIFCEPVGYLTSVFLVNNAEKIVTDSGGLQREAFFAKKPCVTVLDFVSWPETMVGNMNVLAKPEKGDILRKLKLETQMPRNYMPFGDGRASVKIVRNIEKFMEDKR